MASSGKCLICNALAATTLEDVKVEKVWGREMEVMFALQQVLQVPASLLANFLVESATGNVGLLTLCGDCRQLVGECRELDEQLQNLKRRWIKCSARVVAKVKAAATAEVEENASPVEGPPTKAKDLRLETRRFVINHAYPFGELKRLLDNQMTQMPAEKPRDSNGGSGDPSTNPGNEVVEGESADVALDPQTETVGVVPVEETVAQEIIGQNPVAESNSEVGQPSLTDDQSDRSSSATCGAGNHYVVIEHILEDMDMAPAPLPDATSTSRRNRKKRKKMRPRPCPSKMCFDCLFCPAKHQSFSILERHVRVHTGERPFWCRVCGKEFPRKFILTDHQRTHTGEKAFQCDLCGKGFYDRSNLRRHAKVHLGEKPWICETCGKAFLLKAQLIQHRVVHTGERPFKCDLCGKCFGRKTYLTQHKKLTHSAKLIAKK